MLDSYGRNINYLRISLTERCQLRCTYCAREHGGECVRDSETDTEGILFAASVFGDFGFEKIRLTGGEPLLRRDILDIVSGINSLKKYKEIAMTTNGVMLEPLADELKNAGLNRVNISLDSLDSDVYRAITGASSEKTVRGIKKAVGTFDKVKINVVIIDGVNNESTDAFVNFARENPVDVRFIELMPMGTGEKGIKNSDILARFPYLYPCENGVFGEPAKYYTADGFSGRVGFISPVSSAFCADCNRMRLTSDGHLRLCLGCNDEIDISAELREKNREELKKKIIEAVSKKPRNGFGDGFVTDRKMDRIGG